MRKNLLRTKDMHAAYDAFRETRDNHQTAGTLNNPNDELVHDYVHWVIIKNNFPYDAIASQHDLLVPKRVFGTLQEATSEERAEYDSILQQLDGEGIYDALQVNFSVNRSISRHYHVQLLTWKQVDLDR